MRFDQITKQNAYYSEPFGFTTIRDISSAAENSWRKGTLGKKSAEKMKKWRDSIVLALLTDPQRITENELEEKLEFAREKKAPYQTHLERASIVYALIIDGIFNIDENDSVFLASSQTVKELGSSVDFIITSKLKKFYPTKIFAILDPEENYKQKDISIYRDPNILEAKTLDYQNSNKIIQSLLNEDTGNITGVDSLEDLPTLGITEIEYLFGLATEEQLLDLHEEEDIAPLTRIRDVIVSIIRANGAPEMYLSEGLYMKMRTLFNYLNARQNIVRMNQNISPDDNAIPQALFISVVKNEPLEKFRARTIEQTAVIYA